MHLSRKLCFVFAVILWTAAAPLADAAPYLVLESAGQAEMFDAAQNRWQTLPPESALKKGDKIRTGSDGSVELAGDPSFENVFHVGPGSQVTLLHQRPLRIALDQGSLWMINETPLEVRILTREFLVSIREGGCAVDISSGTGVLKVFGESVQVFEKALSGYSDWPLAVEEGFRFVSGKAERMDYSDYAEWQVWYKKNDARKDKHVSKR